MTTEPVGNQQPQGERPGRFRSGGGARPRPRWGARRRVCVFCADKSESIDYKDAARLRRFVADSGKILSRRRSGVCARHQRELTTAIKRARHLAMLPFTSAQQGSIG